MKILVEIDGDGLVDYLREQPMSSVLDIGEPSYIVTAPIQAILDGVLENLVVVFEEGDGD